MELENWMAKQQVERKLRDRQYQLGKEREVMKLQLQQLEQEEELRLRQQEQKLKNERKKAEADKEQRIVKLELTKEAQKHLDQWQRR